MYAAFVVCACGKGDPPPPPAPGPDYPHQRVEFVGGSSGHSLQPPDPLPLALAQPEAVPLARAPDRGRGRKGWGAGVNVRPPLCVLFPVVCQWPPTSLHSVVCAAASCHKADDGGVRGGGGGSSTFLLFSMHPHVTCRGHMAETWRPLANCVYGSVTCYQAPARRSNTLPLEHYGPGTLCPINTMCLEQHAQETLPCWQKDGLLLATDEHLPYVPAARALALP